MNQDLINRYQPGGDIYASLTQKYGPANAAAIAAAALTGDETQVNAAMVQAQYGAPLNDSTLSLFTEQVTTDPLAAPLEGANKIIGNSFVSLLKNPWVIAAAAIGAFFFFGGADFLRRKMKGN